MCRILHARAIKALFTDAVNPQSVGAVVNRWDEKARSPTGCDGLQVIDALGTRDKGNRQ